MWIPGEMDCLQMSRKMSTDKEPAQLHESNDTWYLESSLSTYTISFYPHNDKHVR